MVRVRRCRVAALFAMLPERYVCYAACRVRFTLRGRQYAKAMLTPRYAQKRVHSTRLHESERHMLALPYGEGKKRRRLRKDARFRVLFMHTLMRPRLYARVAAPCRERCDGATSGTKECQR